MEWIDEIAGLVGMRHSNGNIITASVDNLRFIRGAYQNDFNCVGGQGDICREYFDGGAGGYVCRGFPGGAQAH